MFSGFMMNAWIVASIVAVVAGVVGFFVVARGSAFAAHALPQSAFTGAAAAYLIGISTVYGMGAFALASALGIAWLGRRGRHDVVTALILVMLLGLGELFLSYSVEYAQATYSLLFGEVLGVSTNEILPTALLSVAAILAVTVVYRPLMFTSVLPEIGEARGVRAYRMEVLFLLILALTTTASVPVVGALLMFSLMVGPPAASRCFTDNPPVAIALSVALALMTVWASLAIAYERNWPVGFLVGTISAAVYVVGRMWAAWRRRRVVHLRSPGAQVEPGLVATAGT
ncbi:MAG: metal ABC transporter permease [Acidimicrobiales bacterium]|jgi:zinc/manganese transport system permease protein